MSVAAGVAGRISDFADQIPSVASVVSKLFVGVPRFRLPSALESVTCFGPIVSKLLSDPRNTVLRKCPGDGRISVISS